MEIFDFYSKPTQYGGELPFFVGERYNQIGGGFLGNVGRFLLPILKSLGKKVLGIGIETAHDYVNKNRPMLDSLVKRAADVAEDNEHRDVSNYLKGLSFLPLAEVCTPLIFL